MNYPVFRVGTLDPSKKFVARHETASTPQYLTTTGGTSSRMSEALIFAPPLVPALHGLTYDASGCWTDAHGFVQFRAVEFSPNCKLANARIVEGFACIDGVYAQLQRAATLTEWDNAKEALDCLRQLRGTLRGTLMCLDEARTFLEGMQALDEGGS